MSKKFLPFALPYITEEELKEVRKVLNSGWLTTGKFTFKFEEMFKKYIGCKYAIGVSSCTAALHLSLLAVGVKNTQEVITSCFTFCATANSIEYTGAKPVFADIDEETYNISPDEIKKRITENTVAIIPVDYAGHPVELKEILKIAEENSLYVIEDAAHALGSEYENKKIGNISHLTCFSFYPTKNITTGEGGMVTTNNLEFAEKIKILSLHGINRDAWKRYRKEGSWYYEEVELGYKYNLPDINSAIGIVQLKRIEKFLKIREKYAKIYDENLKNVEEIVIPKVRKNVRHSYHLYPILLESKKLKRDEFIEELKKQGIGASVHFLPVHLHPYYKNKYKYKEGDFPVAEKIYKKIVSLPLYPKMEESDIIRVVKSIKNILKRRR
jgi:perosamine synthetase